METNDIAEQLEYYFNNGLEKDELKLARKEFINGNKAPYIWCFLADACCSIGKYARRGKILAKKALEIINKELENDKDNEKLLLYFAIINFELENYEVAQNTAEKLIALNNKNGYYYALLSYSYSWQECFEDALLYITKAIELEPNKAKYYWSCGIYYNRLKKYEESIKYHNKAIELEPNNAQYYYERGLSKAWLGDWQGELQDQLKAIELAPDNAEYYYRCGIDYYELCNYDESIKYFTKTIEIAPNNAEAYYQRGWTKTIISGLGVGIAFNDFKKAFELQPNNIKYCYWAALDSNGKESIKYYTMAIELEPDTIEYYCDRCNAYGYWLGYEKALEEYKILFNLKPGNAEIYFRCALNCELSKQYKDAVKYYTKAIDINNKYTRAYYKKAETLYMARQLIKAINILLDALEICENERDTLFTALSFMYFAQNDYKKALKYANEALSLNKENGTGYYRKYCALTALGKQDEAREYLEKANKFGYNECF